MEIINRYFGKIIFVKADLREDHSIYVAALSSSFQDGKKQYALAFVPVHLAIINQGYLSDLQWVNLQTRTMTNGYRIKPQRWEIPKGLDNPMFAAVERTESKTKYVSEQYPLEMVLIHDPKKKTKMQYHNHMNLLAALTTFKCVISLTEPDHPVRSSSQAVRSNGISSMPLTSLGISPSGGYAQTHESGDPNQLQSIIQRQNFSPLPSAFYTGDASYVSGSGSYAPGADGRYTSIGLSDYTIPQVPQNPQRNRPRGESTHFGGASAKRMTSFGQTPASQTIGSEPGFQEHIDDSYELIS